ncbi:MAG: alpha-N-acetylglucosaminidase, partial [Paramuribaculum sp.]|nr:alpha-N-acetylglucosaminidase [Paramuribaculum sp.]
MKKILLILFCIVALDVAAVPIDSLAYRVTEGTSPGRIIFREIPADKDFFEIKASDGKVVIEGNNPVSMATGLNWYLKYVAGIHISWNNLTQPLPEVLPLPQQPIRTETEIARRYYLNYCTFSYSMAFWDEERWMKEIDWMALHGINMPLSLTGIET